MPRKRNTLINSFKKYIYQEIVKSLNDLDIESPANEFSLSSPKYDSFGDLSSNISMILAKSLKDNPIDIANRIKNNLIEKKLDNIEDINVTPPGFINFVIKSIFYQNQIKSIIKDGSSFGKEKIGKGKSANVEFVSANPTGPLTVGHGRNAVIGDTVSNILEWHDYKVIREYYYNDAGKQMRVLAKSVESRYFDLNNKQSEFPEDGYQGEYIIDIAKEIIQSFGKNLHKNDSTFLSEAERVIFKQIKDSLKKLRIKFDTFTNEKSFYDSGAIEKLLSQLKDKDLIYEKEGATWYRATSAGGKQDKVYIKSTGEPTYRLPDTAYHKDKIIRSYDLIVDVFGADHTDTYPDVLSALNALGLKTDHIKILIYQFVTLIRDGEKVKMSTRKADFVTLDDLLNELGIDVVRYFFIMRSMKSHLDFDLDLAKDQSDKNPVFYLQYAHARICNIIKHGESQGFQFSDNFDPSILNNENELKLIKLMSNFPIIMNAALETLEPQNIANYLQSFSTHFHKFYGTCKVITKNKELTQARLGLVYGAKIILSTGLSILGISAPKKM